MVVYPRAFGALILALSVLVAQACISIVPRGDGSSNSGDGGTAIDGTGGSGTGASGDDPLPNADSDGDGLTTAFEQQIGTDPDLDDTDGDGFSDALEYLTYFSPTNEEDYPYSGNYPRGPLMSSEEWDAYKEDQDSSWSEMGLVSKGWIHDDHPGQELKLKRFFGSVVLIDLGSEWCGPCRAITETLEDEYQARKDQGFVVVQVLMDGISAGTPPDIEGWVEEYGLTFPNLSDFDREVAEHYVPESEGWSIPNFTIIDRAHKLQTWYSVGSVDWSFVDQLLDEPAPEVDYPMPDNASELYESLGLVEGAWSQSTGGKDSGS